jgi:hypothetical protein
MKLLILLLVLSTFASESNDGRYEARVRKFSEAQRYAVGIINTIDPAKIQALATYYGSTIPFNKETTIQSIRSVVIAPQLDRTRTYQGKNFPLVMDYKLDSNQLYLLRPFFDVPGVTSNYFNLYDEANRKLAFDTDTLRTLVHELSHLLGVGIHNDEASLLFSIDLILYFNQFYRQSDPMYCGYTLDLNNFSPYLATLSCEDIQASILALYNIPNLVTQQQKDRAANSLRKLEELAPYRVINNSKDFLVVEDPESGKQIAVKKSSSSNGEWQLAPIEKIGTANCDLFKIGGLKTFVKPEASGLDDVFMFYLKLTKVGLLHPNPKTRNPKESIFIPHGAYFLDSGKTKEEYSNFAFIGHRENLKARLFCER